MNEMAFQTNKKKKRLNTAVPLISSVCITDNLRGTKWLALVLSAVLGSEAALSSAGPLECFIASLMSCCPSVSVDTVSSGCCCETGAETT